MIVSLVPLAHLSQVFIPDIHILPNKVSLVQTRQQTLIIQWLTTADIDCIIQNQSPKSANDMVLKNRDYHTGHSDWMRRKRNEKYQEIDERRRRRAKTTGVPLEKIRDEQVLEPKRVLEAKRVLEPKRDIDVQIEKGARQKSRKIGLLNRIRSQSIESNETADQEIKNKFFNESHESERWHRDDSSDRVPTESNKEEWSF